MSGKDNFLVLSPMYQERAEEGGDNIKYQRIVPLLIILLQRVDCILLALVGLGDYSDQSTGPGSAML